MGKSNSRTPHGVRGLKFLKLMIHHTRQPSHSAWSAWIEMSDHQDKSLYAEAHSAWSAWIEITRGTYLPDEFVIALRMECVD